jgi:hypothetical protein
VNVAQRLESNCAPGSFLINHETHSQVDDLINVEERQSVSLHGIERHTRTYAIKARKAEADKPLRLSHPQGVHFDLSLLSLGVDDRQLIASKLQALSQQMEVH